MMGQTIDNVAKIAMAVIGASIIYQVLEHGSTSVSLFETSFKGVNGLEDTLFKSS
jgi:hypothetical protein